jgi:diadenosine tetraphosphate (Ap4A) HIT family hydrolase
LSSDTPEHKYPLRDGCVFCKISSGDEPAKYLAPGGIESENRSDLDAEGPLAFRNRLTWVRVMALVVPPGHPSQEQFWGDRELYVPLILYALALGRELTIDNVPDDVAPEGFRAISNFGRIAHQSQDHAHVHVIARPDYEPMPAVVEDTAPLDTSSGEVIVEPAEVLSAPWSVRLTLAGTTTQEQMWADKRIPDLVDAAVILAEDESPEGFRFAAEFLPEPGMGPAGLYILGGGQLDLYA